MGEKQSPLDLSLWLDKELILRQNQLKSSFLSLLEEISNAIPNEELNKVHKTSRGKKISKGNDLIGFPYQVLDLIRDFSSDSSCNIRLLNWFGHGFFVMLLLDKKSSVNPEHLIKSGFRYGLTDSPWDFPELIIGKNHSDDLTKYQQLSPDFRLWFKPIDLEDSLELNRQIILKTLKNLLDILYQSSERKRN